MKRAATTPATRGDEAGDATTRRRETRARTIAT